MARVDDKYKPKIYHFDQSVQKTADDEIDRLIWNYGPRIIHTNAREDYQGVDRWLTIGNRVMFADYKSCKRISDTGNFVVETHHTPKWGRTWPGWAYKLDYVDYIPYYDTVNKILYVIPTQRIEENLANWRLRRQRTAQNSSREGRAPYTTFFATIPLREMMSLRCVKKYTLADVPPVRRRTTDRWRDYVHVDLVGKNKRFTAPDARRVIRVYDNLTGRTADFSPNDERQRAKYARYESLFPGLDRMNRLPNVLRESREHYRIESTPHGSVLRVGDSKWQLHHEKVRGGDTEVRLLQALSQAVVSNVTTRAQVLQSLEEARDAGFRNPWSM